MDIGKDKVAHFFVCFFATIAVSLSCFKLGQLSSILCGVFFALGLGLGKEYGDSKATGNKWSWADILADALGIVVAVVSLMIAWRD